MRFLALALIFTLTACGGTTPVTPTPQPATPYVYDQNPDLKNTPSDKVQEDYEHLPPATKDQADTAHKTPEEKVKAKLLEMEIKIRSDHRRGIAAKEIVTNRTREYKTWVEAQTVQPTDLSGWIFKRVQEAFDYPGKLHKLETAFAVFAAGVVCNDQANLAAFTEAVATVSAISVEIVAAAAFVGFDPSFGVITTFVVAPAGYIGGAALGEFVIAPIIIDAKCN